MVFVESYQGVLLVGEFDGHGVEGEPVVSHCRLFCTHFLKANIDLALDNPAQFITNLNVDCDLSLKKKVDCRMSGSTAVLMLLVEGAMYLSCLGDSRAVLATTAPMQNITQPPRGEDKLLLEGIKGKRIVTPAQALTAEQLTQDQKPEDPEELKRITEAGGVVMRLEDDRGRKVGPYRVWKVEGLYPGIAMSRSLGDMIAQEIGVSSTPVITAHKEATEHDFFLVLASDGVWDVMENQEVCDFVEAYRNLSIRGTSEIKTLEAVKPGDVTIAQLLCEEARARWLSVVEAEDVLIDDISCIIIELQIIGIRKRRAPQRSVVPMRDPLDIPGLERTMKRSNTHAPKRVPAPNHFDDSLVREVDLPDEKGAQAVVRDPRRSSISDAPGGV